MISQLPKKLLTIRPNSRQEINLKTLRFAFWTSAALLTAHTTSAVSDAATLQWGRTPMVAQQASTSPRTTPNRQTKLQDVRRTRTVRDASVMAAVWDADDNQVDGQTTLTDHSVVVERITPTYDYDPPAYDPPSYDPFDEDDRLAQLPDDPFDEPAEDSNGIPEPEDDLDALEQALEAEIDRRRSPDDAHEEDPDETVPDEPVPDDPGPDGPVERDPLQEFSDTDPLDDLLNEDNALERDLDLEKVQPDPEEIDLPNLEYDYNRRDSDESDEPTPEELAEQQKELEEEQRKSAENCQQELADLSEDRISSIDLDIGVKGNAGEDYPFECRVSSGTHQPRQWPQITYNWKAAALCHKPLYFEQVQLERYGHSWGPYMQPIMSGVHFFGTLPVLPYKMGIRTPCECVYTLGYYRPGSCAPYMIEPIPFTWRAAMFQGAAVTGTAFVIP